MKRDKRERLLKQESEKQFLERKVSEVTLKLHLGTKARQIVSDKGSITTKTSLKLAKLQSVA